MWGGLARTLSYKGYRYDIGGHRFFTKVPRVQDLWEEVLGGDLLTRVTRVCRFLRRTSLNELPQLFNMLEGAMSLVGPRPHPVSLNNEYAATIGGYFRGKGPISLRIAKQSRLQQWVSDISVREQASRSGSDYLSVTRWRTF